MSDFYTHRPFLIRELEKLKSKDSVKILELGTGDGSSLVLNEFANLYDNFTIQAFETDYSWFCNMREKYETNNYQFNHINNWNSLLDDSYQTNKFYDLIFIDQSPWEARMQSFEKFKKSAGVIILHDYDYFNKGVIENIYSVDETSVFGKYRELFELENNFEVLPPTLVCYKK